MISEVSIVRGENDMYLYKVGTRSSVLIKQVSFKRFHCNVLATCIYTTHITIVHYCLTFRQRVRTVM